MAGNNSDSQVLIISGFFVAIALGIFYADFVEVSDLEGSVYSMNEMTIETGSKIGIYGLGLTGQSIAKFLDGKGFSLHLFDDSQRNRHLHWLRNLRIKFTLVMMILIVKNT